MARYRGKPRPTPPPRCSDPRCVGCQLVPHAPLILSKLASLTAESLSDEPSIADRLRTAMVIWQRMCGGTRGQDGQTVAADFRHCFQDGHRYRLDTMTAYSGEQREFPLVVFPSEALPSAHMLEGPLLSALVPFLTQLTALTLCVGDDPQDHFMDGLASLFEHVRRSTGQYQGPANSHRRHVETSIYRGSGHWRFCDVAATAFPPFPKSFLDLVQEQSPHIPARGALSLAGE